MKSPFLIALFACAATQMACSKNIDQPVQCRSNALAQAQDFNKVYQKDEFRIFYSTLASSKHRLKQIKDQNNNAVPDYVEDVATQAIASREIFKAAGFRHPLHSPRYNNVKNISIFIQDMKGNGVAYEAPASHPNLPNPMPCSLVLHISSDLKDFPGNYWTTVTHELFHLYQYGYTQFKNTWYLESLANWSERALRVDLVSSTKNLPALPQSSRGIQKEIIGKAYNPLWKRLSVIEGHDRLVIPAHLQKMRYSNGSLVFKDHEWRNTALVLNLMQNLEQSSLKISKDKQWNAYNWKESDQRLKQWDAMIWKNIQAALISQDYQTKEVQQLKRLQLQP
ncbi:hypothetical protein [Acinetobacter sp. B51(2017)]|uniref:hypothetical protein n=1 Tax=Acinetobacter sp. B51(2017) TaxID=2060938 RepID=UPI0013DEC7BC|nr:hypothetical protein [Acinetobacter sp. B51(2017)]